jgi:hypothetical protein
MDKDTPRGTYGLSAVRPPTERIDGMYLLYPLAIRAPMWTSWSSLPQTLHAQGTGLPQTTVIVDGLRKPERPRFPAGLRKLRIRVHKVRGARDQSDEFIRLADAVAGGIWGNIEGGSHAGVVCCSAACLMRCRLLLRRWGVTSFAEDEQRLSSLWGNHRRETVACFEAGMHGRDPFRQAPV